MKRIIHAFIAIGIITLSIVTKEVKAQNQYDFEDYVLNIRNTIIDVNYPLFKEIYGLGFQDVIDILKSSTDVENDNYELLQLLKYNHEYLFELEFSYENLIIMAYSKFYTQNSLLFNQTNYKLIDYAYHEIIDEEFESVDNLKLYSAILFFQNDNTLFITYIDNTIVFNNKLNLGDITTIKLSDYDEIKEIKKEFNTNKHFNLYNYLYNTDVSSTENYIFTETQKNETIQKNTINKIYKYRGQIDGKEYAIEMHKDTYDNIVKLSMIDLKTNENVSLIYYYDMTSTILMIQMKDEGKSLVLLQTLNGNWNGSIYDMYTNILISTFSLNQLVK